MGCQVIRKDKVIAELQSVTGEDVCMKDDTGKLLKCNFKSFILGDFATFSAKKVPVFMDFVHYPLLADNHKTKVECLKALVICSSFDHYVNNSKNLEMLRICRKPHGVQTIGKIGKGKLQLYAYSNSVHVRKPGESDWNFALLVVPVYGVVNLTVYISSLFSLVVFPTTVETPNMFLVQLLV